ncbi:MAG: hypothetical protein A3E25_02840 [Burkholderiales bacterium RIFCSPHIGHO2_12_FULL_69_20]|nr:MAG: hypothetical protein A3E25_02840 [Burkholderiales bacterium RIFCSPHIGHO2_12_FULL_69_20]
MTGTRVYLLGAPAVAHQGASIPFLDERRYQLLAYLAFSGDWVERDRLAGLLWPDHEAGAARRNLRKIVFRAREAPWSADLQVRGDRLRWAVATDLAEFRQALASGRLAAACAAYAGPLLGGMDDAGTGGFSAWLLAHRASLHVQWRDAALTVLPTLGTAAERAAAARRLVDDDPFDERAMCAALAVLTADGKPAEAQALYREYTHRLTEDLGVEPSAAVRAAAQAAAVAPPILAAGARDERAAAVPAPQPDGCPTDNRGQPPVLPGLPTDGFVGRRSERRELLALVQRPPCRVITIFGPGGIGKSRFAREQLAPLALLVPAGVHWVALEDVASASQLLARLAQVLHAPVNDASDVVVQIAARHAAQRRLLVLDNAEHLPALGAWLQPLLVAWPLLQLVLTSRARVGLADEWLLPLGGLAVPDSDSRDLEAAVAFDAVRLFDLRARAVLPGFDLAAHLDAVIAVVERVDGMPLAIELAAAWVRLLPPAEIVRELAHSIDILQRDAASTEPMARPEHASIHAVFRRSWDLLAPSERHALAAVTVFCGGFRRDAAAAVAGASLPVLASLVDKSLLFVDAEGRFGMHPLIAAWATDTPPAEPGLQAAPTLRHAEFFAAWLDSQARAATADVALLVTAMLPEFANCERAWHAAVAAQRAELVATLRPALLCFAEAQGRWREMGALLGAALASDGLMRALPGLRLDLLLDLSTVHFHLGELHPCEALARSALALARQASLPDKRVTALNNIGVALLNRGEAALALPVLQEAAELARACGERLALGYALLRAATAHKVLDDMPRNLALNEEALAVMREVGNHNGVAIVLNNLGDTLRQTGDYPRARELLETGLALAEEHGLLPRVQNFRLCLGVLLLDSGQWAASRPVLEQALAGTQRHGQFQMELLCLLRLARLDRAQGDAQACLRRCREVLSRARPRGFEGLVRQALAEHAQLLLTHGDRDHGLQLLAFLEADPLLPTSSRRYARLDREAAEAEPAHAAGVAPPALDLDTAALRLLAHHPGIDD